MTSNTSKGSGSFDINAEFRSVMNDLGLSPEDTGGSINSCALVCLRCSAPETRARGRFEGLCRGTGENPTVDQRGNPACANHNVARPQFRFGTLTFSCIG
jgi:hypothetical protein